MVKKLIIIQCSKSKQKGIHKVCDLYTSQLFKKGLDIAKKLNGNIKIISAKYGLISINEKIKKYEYGFKPSPYMGKEDKNRRKQRNIYNKRVMSRLVNKLKKQRLGNHSVIVLANKYYQKSLVSVFPNKDFDFWFNGSKGLFDLQSNFLDNKLKEYLK